MLIYTRRDAMAYGDWGFFPEVGAEHFEEINKVVRTNFDGDKEQFETGIEFLWTAILKGFQRLENDGFFGTGTERSKITLLVVGHLPSEFINSWVSALNPPDIADRYINWNCDARDDGNENG